MKKIQLLILILIFCPLFSSTTHVNGLEYFTSETQFSILSYNSTITFSAGGSYGNASLLNNTWYFTDLLLANATSFFPFFNGIRFSVSAQNCNMSINQIDTLDVFPPSSGWITYTVTGMGNQTLNLNYSRENWLSYTVYIDDQEKPQNDSWTISKEGGITVANAKSNVKIFYQKAHGTFTFEDVFRIPEQNSSINFAFNGTYVYANLQNNIWRFQNLLENGQKNPNIPTWYLSITARNCAITITDYHSNIISYTVAGVGNQSFDNNYNKLDSRKFNNHTVIIDGISRSQNDNYWTLSEDGWLTVFGAKSNVTLIYEYISTEEPPPKSGLTIDNPGLFSVIMGFITSTPGFIFLLFTLLFVGVITFLVVVGNRKRKQNPRRGES